MSTSFVSLQRRAAADLHVSQGKDDGRLDGLTVPGRRYQRHRATFWPSVHLPGICLTEPSVSIDEPIDERPLTDWDIRYVRPMQASWARRSGGVTTARTATVETAKSAAPFSSQFQRTAISAAAYDRRLRRIYRAVGSARANELVASAFSDCSDTQKLRLDSARWMLPRRSLR